MRIGCRTLAALDVRVHVTNDGFLQSFWRNSAFEACARAVARARGSQFIEDVLVNVIVIPVHHSDDFCEVSKDGVRPFNHNLRLGQSPSCTGGNVLRNIVTCSIQECLVIEVAHDNA